MAQIGIILPCYYPNETIRKAFISIAKQTRRDAVEVFMVNDCSPHTNCKYQDLFNEFSNQFTIKYLETPTNSGPGVARQLALEQCNCPWVMFHDDDDALNNPYVIEKYLDVINNYQEDISSLLSIECDQLYAYVDGSSERMLGGTICGNLFNLNLLRKHKIDFSANISFYEEDRFFAFKLYYYMNKYQYKILHMKDIDSDFICYTKYNTNRLSLCATIDNETKYKRILQAYNCIFDFYLSIPVDVDYFTRELNGAMQYLNNYCFSIAQCYNLSDEDRYNFSELNRKFQQIKSLCSGSPFDNDQILLYNKFMESINLYYEMEEKNIMTPVIGIILPCYYSSDVIRKALTMLSWQTHKEAIEVIMINDCSPNTDCNYQDLIKEFSNQLNLKYLKTETRSGPGVARQLGMDNCNCPWVMFHDDDDILNNPYVIEEYLNAINSIASNCICIEVSGPHLQFWGDLENNCIKCDKNFTGKLFNLNLIKFFNVQFAPLSYEEDCLFATEYFYYCRRLSKFFPEISIDRIDVCNKKPDFIAYTKLANSQSICAQLQEDSRIYKALAFLNAKLDFYLSIPQDDLFESLMCQELQDTLNYLLNWIGSIQQFEKNEYYRQELSEFNAKFSILIQSCPNALSQEHLSQYYNFINQYL